MPGLERHIASVIMHMISELHENSILDAQVGDNVVRNFTKTLFSLITFFLAFSLSIYIYIHIEYIIPKSFFFNCVHI